MRVRYDAFSLPPGEREEDNVAVSGFVVTDE